MVLLYLFSFGDGWVKLGCARCPYERLQRGFWQNVHPEALCNKLDDAKLLRLWAGTWTDEQALHAALLPCCLGRALDGKGREDHMFRSLATKGKTRPCPKCGKEISIRNDKLKAHQKSKGCRQ